MRKKNDCLFIGHNEGDLTEYEKQVKEMGENSGAYRSLNIDLIRFNNTLYGAADIFNLIHRAGNSLKDSGDSVLY